MKILHKTIVLCILSVLSVSASGICLEEKNSQTDRKKGIADASKSLEENKKLLEFYKQRNMIAGKMMMGMSNETIEQTTPAGVKMGALKPSSAAEEFFISIDKSGYSSDLVNMAENMLPRKKTK